MPSYVILHSQHSSMALGTVIVDSCPVQRLEGVHHSDVDTGLAQGLCRLQGLVKGDSCRDDEDEDLVSL